MNIYIIAVGKIKDNYLKEGISEFRKRLSAYCKLSIHEVEDEKSPENLSHKEKIKLKDKESDQIYSVLPKSSYVIALDIQGKSLSSEELSEHIETLRLEGKSDISFIIGGSLGLSDNLLKQADYRLSFSKMTFPHQLMRLILLEQIYRSFRILHHQPYHK